MLSFFFKYNLTVTTVGIGEFLLFIMLLHLPMATVSGIQCERITVEACQGLGYNMTAMPNLAGHTTQLDAEIVINELLPIFDSECSKHARFLLCASIFPLCSPDVSRPVAACKSLCQTVKSDCTKDPTLLELWPKFIDCDTLPQPEKQELCMQVPQREVKLNQNNSSTTITSTLPSSSSSSSSSKLANAIINTNNKIASLSWPWAPWKTSISTSPSSSSSSSSNSMSILPMSKVICPVNYTVVGDECGPQCGTDAMFTAHQKKIADTWTLALSAICFILTLFSLVTFWAEPMRFGYPERPVLFLALCYNLLSVSYLERVIFHNPSMKEEQLGGACGTTTLCVASFIATSYLTLSAASWWLIFSICWWLSTQKQWSSEALEKKSSLFHVLAWIPPLAPPIAAFISGSVKSHELTGMCGAFGFIEIPTLTLLLIGAIFTILASKSLRALSKTVNDDSFNRKLTQVRARIIIFTCVFFAPAFLAEVLRFFESKYQEIPSCIFGDPCVAPKKFTSIPTLLRLFFTLAGGSLAGMWVWSKKTCESYRSRIPHHGGGGGGGGVGVGGGGVNSTSIMIGGGNIGNGAGGGLLITGSPGGGLHHHHHHHVIQQSIITAKPSNMTKMFIQQQHQQQQQQHHQLKNAKHIGPLYAGINFHNVPVYNSTSVVCV